MDWDILFTSEILILTWTALLLLDHCVKRNFLWKEMPEIILSACIVAALFGSQCGSLATE